MKKLDTAIHLAIIPDGNRRWAKQRGLLPWQGHKAAVDVLQSVVEHCETNEQVGVITLWLFSTENWKRSPLEISKLMGILETYLKKQAKKWSARNIRFVHSGRKDRIPATLASVIANLEQDTAANNAFTVHLALDYGGKDEITRAVQKMYDSQLPVENIAQTIANNLDHPELPKIDLIIRTSGEMRTSNFFLWQSTYAEWFFIQKFLPDLLITDIETVLEEFNNRTRRFGGS